MKGRTSEILTRCIPSISWECRVVLRGGASRKIVIEFSAVCNSAFINPGQEKWHRCAIYFVPKQIAGAGTKWQDKGYEGVHLGEIHTNPAIPLVANKFFTPRNSKSDLQTLWQIFPQHFSWKIWQALLAVFESVRRTNQGNLFRIYTLH